MGMLARHFAEDGQVARDDRHAVLGTFDQRQAEAFAFGWREQGGGRLVELFQHFVGHAGEPEQALVFLDVFFHALGQLVHHPALFADNDEVDVHTLLPQQLEGGQRLRVALARLHCAHHQEAGSAGHAVEHQLRMRGQAGGWSAGAQVGAQVEPGDIQGRGAARGLLAVPGGQFVGDGARDADDAIGHGGDGIEEVAEVLFGPEGEHVGAQHGQQVVDDEVDLGATVAHRLQQIVVLADAVGEQVQAQEHVAGAQVDRCVFEAQVLLADHAQGVAARVLVAAIAAGAEHRLDAEARRRFGDQCQQYAAHDTLDPGLEVRRHHRRDIDEELALAGLRCVEGDGAGGVAQLHVFDMAGNARDGVDGVAVDAVAAVRGEVFDGVVVLLADAVGRVVFAHQRQCAVGQAPPFAGVVAQAGQGVGQLAASEVVGQLEQGAGRDFGGRTMRIGDGGQAVQQAVQHGGRGFAARVAAQLDGAVAGGQVVGIGFGADKAGDGDALGGGALFHLVGQVGAIAARVVLAHEDQLALRVAC